MALLFFVNREERRQKPRPTMRSFYAGQIHLARLFDDRQTSISDRSEFRVAPRLHIIAA